MSERPPKRNGVAPRLRRWVERLGALGWSPDSPSSECVATLCPPPIVLRCRGIDRLGLLYVWCRLRALTHLYRGNVRAIQRDEWERLCRTAYMHAVNWLAELYFIEIRRPVDHVALYHRLCAWDLIVLDPHHSVEAALTLQPEAPCETARNTYRLVTVDAKTLSREEHRDAFAKGELEHLLLKGYGVESGPTVTSADNGEGMWAIYELLGGAKTLAYIEGGQIRVNAQDVRDAFNRVLSGVVAPVRIETSDVDIATPPATQKLAPEVEAVIEILQVDEVQDVLDLEDLDSLLRDGVERLRGSPDAAKIAARLRRATGASRSKLAMLLGTTEKRIRGAEERLGEG